MKKGVVLLTPWKITDPAMQGVVAGFLQKIDLSSKITWIHPHKTLGPKDPGNLFFKEKCAALKKEKPFFWVFDPTAGQKLCSEKMKKHWEDFQGSTFQQLVLVLGGAFGLPESCMDFDPRIDISLSDMTMSHEIAMLVVLEQLYRVQLMHKGHPYHHGTSSHYANLSKKRSGS